MPTIRTKSAVTKASASAPCPGKAWECFWTLSLDKGQLTVEGPFYDSGYSVLAITGGTGEFAGALGEMALSARGTKGDAYNFVYRIK